MKHNKEQLTLADVKPGNRVIVVGFHEEGPVKLLEMGLIPGNEVYVKRVAPLGDPIHITVAGFDLALRKSEAAFIDVEYLITEQI